MINYKDNFRYITIKAFECESGFTLDNLVVSYEVFGNQERLHTHCVMICHALTSNSHVGPHEGWWEDMVGYGKCIDLDHYACICFNIPGNGMNDGEEHIEENYKKFTTRDVARILGQCLDQLGIHTLHSIIGASLGGGFVWELIYMYPDRFRYAFPFVSHYKAPNWVRAQCYVQDQILNHSHDHSLEIARSMAMMFYRSPSQFCSKFDGQKNLYAQHSVEHYLEYQGQKLKERFTLPAYKMMNHLLASIDITRSREATEVFTRIKAEVIAVGIRTDVLFDPNEIKEGIYIAKSYGLNATYIEMDSVYGHDGFLIEYEKISNLLCPYFIK